ncbi:hypothetical protein DPMN_079920 [Dreissena polymorpha]|uniref:C-type lectin domain-containing protein n=1 Tax=Dreissena polymorpha TaxID=45954 RepID=A0A9D3YU21_DREPO|nr:hypothetical protein DPMN_079920 [Dreissena polymorpha]
MLFPYPYYNTIYYMAANIPYTIGMFRTFTPVNKQTLSAAFPCLAVTRVGNEVWLEPEDCAAKRRYLCNNLQYVDYYPKERVTADFNEESTTTVTTESGTKSSEYRTTIIIVVVTVSIAGLIIGALLRYYFVQKSRTRTKGTTSATFGNAKDCCITSQELGARNNPNADDCPNNCNENKSIVLQNYEYSEVVDSNIIHNTCLINDNNIESPETEITPASDEYSSIMLNKNCQSPTENVYDHTNSVLPPESCRVRPGETSMVNTLCHIYDLTSVGVTEDTYNSIVNTGQTIVFSSDYDHIHPKDRANGDVSSDYNHINSKD